MLVYIDNSSFKIIKNKKKYTFYKRNSIISSFLINKIIFVYNGKAFTKLLVKEQMIGHKLGDFIFTKKRGKNIHKILKKKKDRKKK